MISFIWKMPFSTIVLQRVSPTLMHASLPVFSRVQSSTLSYSSQGLRMNYLRTAKGKLSFLSFSLVTAFVYISLNDSAALPPMCFSK
jgi:hypothetical protein